MMRHVFWASQNRPKRGVHSARSDARTLGRPFPVLQVAKLGWAETRRHAAGPAPTSGTGRHMQRPLARLLVSARLSLGRSADRRPPERERLHHACLPTNHITVVPASRREGKSPPNSAQTTGIEGDESYKHVDCSSFRVLDHSGNPAVASRRQCPVVPTL